MPVLLGLDLGTTNCKVLAMDALGNTLALAAAPTPSLPLLPNPSAKQTSHSPEYDANALWLLFVQLIQQVCASSTFVAADVVGLCVSSMAESGVLVDAAGEPTAPVITWHDLRTKPYLDVWRKRMSPLAVYQNTGLSQDHIYSASKLMWHKQHTPQAFAGATQWLGLADWITFKLTGVHSMSLPMASRTMLFDPQTRAWSPLMLDLAEIPARLMPPLVASGIVVGHLTSQAARLTGLRDGVPVSAGGHDHICGALAVGAIEPGIILDSAGTAEAFMATLDKSIANEVTALPGLGCGCHTAPGKYYLLGGILGGGVVNWLSETLMGDVSLNNVLRLMSEAERAPLGANGVRFLPYLRGSGPPWRDPNAFGSWLRFRLNHTRADLMRAAMEGLSFGFCHVVALMQQLGGLRADALRVTGGSARNTWWQQLKADVIGLPIEVTDEPEASAKGAALLAGIGAGVFADEAEAARISYKPIARYEPDAARHQQYVAIYKQWSRLYPALEEIMREG